MFVFAVYTNMEIDTLNVETPFLPLSFFLRCGSEISSIIKIYTQSVFKY